jgi:hypothetical protein
MVAASCVSPSQGPTSYPLELALLAKTLGMHHACQTWIEVFRQDQQWKTAQIGTGEPAFARQRVTGIHHQLAGPIPQRNDGAERAVRQILQVAGDPGIHDALMEQPKQRAVTPVMARAKGPVTDRRVLKLGADVVRSLQSKWPMVEEAGPLRHKALQADQGEIAQQLQLVAPP